MGTVDATNETAHDTGFGLRDRLAGQEFVDGAPQKVLSRGLSRIADTVLIVDAAVVADHTFLVEDEDFRSPHRTEPVGHSIVEIFKNREADPVDPGIGGDFRQHVLAIRVDSQDLHSLSAVSRLHLPQARTVKLHQRTLGPQKGDDDDFLLAVIRQRVRLAVQVIEDKAIDLSADGRRGGRRGRQFCTECRRRQERARTNGDGEPSLDHSLEILRRVSIVWGAVPLLRVRDEVLRLRHLTCRSVATAAPRRNSAVRRRP